MIVFYQFFLIIKTRLIVVSTAPDLNGRFYRPGMSEKNIIGKKLKNNRTRLLGNKYSKKQDQKKNLIFTCIFYFSP